MCTSPSSIGVEMNVTFDHELTLDEQIAVAMVIAEYFTKGPVVIDGQEYYPAFQPAILLDGKPGQSDCLH